MGTVERILCLLSTALTLSMLAGKRNGELLTLAASYFDVFITVDRNLPKQHDIAQYHLAVVILVSSSNRLTDLQPLVPALLSTLRNIKPGDTIEVG